MRTTLAAAASRRRLPPLIFDFTRQSAGYSSAVPAGLGFSRAACVDSVQTGTSTLVEIASAADVLRYGRALDAWDVGLVLEESRTNQVPRSSDYTTGWSSDGTATLTAGQTGPTGTASATRAQVASGGNTRYFPATGFGSNAAIAVSSWVSPRTPPADVGIVATSGTAASLSANAWQRLVSAGGTGTASAGGACSLYVVYGSASGGISVGARDWLLYGSQIELGKFPTELIPTTGATATRNGTLFSVLNAAWSPYVSTGRLSIELVFRAKGARTEYSGTPYLWHTFDNASAFFNPATGVLTIRDTASSTNTVTLPAWARNDLIELSIQYGGGLATVVKYRLNSGSVVSLSVTGSALASVYTGARDLYLMNSNSAAAGQVSAWLYTARFHANNTCPAWAS